MKKGESFANNQKTLSSLLAHRLVSAALLFHCHWSLQSPPPAVMETTFTTMHLYWNSMCHHQSICHLCGSYYFLILYPPKKPVQLLLTPFLNEGYLLYPPKSVWLHLITTRKRVLFQNSAGKSAAVLRTVLNSPDSKG